MLRLGIEAVLHGLESVIKILLNVRQAHSCRLSDCLNYEGGRVHKAVILYPFEDRISHRHIDNCHQVGLTFFVLLVDAIDYT